MTTGEKIRTLRKGLGLTQTELGKKLGVQTNAVSKWECGRVYDIPTSKIKAMAQLFGVPASYLLDDEESGIVSAGYYRNSEMFAAFQQAHTSSNSESSLVQQVKEIEEKAAPDDLAIFSMVMKIWRDLAVADKSKDDTINSDRCIIAMRLTDLLKLASAEENTRLLGQLVTLLTSINKYAKNGNISVLEGLNSNCSTYDAISEEAAT